MPNDTLEAVIRALDEAETLLNDDRDVYLDLMWKVAQEAMKRFNDVYEGQVNGDARDPSIN